MEKEMVKNYQICNNCVMDTSDQDITFNSFGVCNHCQSYSVRTSNIWFPNDEGATKLEYLFDAIKKENKNKSYDCIMGLSGGLDSSYLALAIKKYNLRVLAVHVDAGWNSELAVSNIEKIVDHCNFDLHTHVVDWNSMKNLHVAYLNSGVANQDVPQDHVFFAVLFKEAMTNHCNTFLSGGNVATELIFPPNWHHSAMDKINLEDIYYKYNRDKLVNYATINFFDFHIGFKLRGFKQIRPLNYMPYNLEDAIEQLEKIGWRNYGRKHGESVFTRFFQNYFLPKRFGYDKRRPHYSSRILSGQLTRSDAISLLEEKLYTDNELKSDRAYICNKLEISDDQLEYFLNLPLRSYNEFKNWDNQLKLLNLALPVYKGIFRK